jgi:acetamidase/formamidase
VKTVLLLWAAALAAAQPQTHIVKPTPKTVVRGYFSAEAAPVVRIRPGDTVSLESAMIADPAMMREGGIPDTAIREADRVIHREVKDAGPGPHVLTGPVYVEGAEPGDTLEVRIKAVDLAFDYAIIILCPGCGMLPDDFPYWRVKSYPLDARTMTARFPGGITVPLRPFFGVMGVAPPPVSGRISTAPPWIHGGNMDNKDLVAGTTLYLPVHARGALFSVGDAHAAQGDGEVNIAALETALTGTFQFFVHKGKLLRWPRAETPTHYMTMGFHENLEEAGRIALREMLDFLVVEKGLARDDAYLLAGSAVDLHVTQVVDGKKGIHATVAKAIFGKH